MVIQDSQSNGSDNVVLLSGCVCTIPVYVFRTDSETTTFLKQNITRLIIQRIYTYKNIPQSLVSWVGTSL